jgi:hypothetical protein
LGKLVTIWVKERGVVSHGADIDRGERSGFLSDQWKARWDRRGLLRGGLQGGEATTGLSIGHASAISLPAVRFGAQTPLPYPAAGRVLSG